MSSPRDDLNSSMAVFIEKMPSLPTSVTKVLEICNHPHTSPADLNRVISLDPVLVGRVFKLINSAYYGLGQQVTSMVRAIIMLGINTVKNLVLSAAVMRTLAANGARQGLDMEGFWRHSLCVGVTAKLLARQRGIDPQLTEEYFTAGLLHDIGKIPLNSVLSAEYMQTISAADRERLPLYRAEDKILGMNHCHTGALIVKAWKLDGPVAETIMNHHSAGPAGSSGDILFSVAAANYFASSREIGFAGNRYPEKPEAGIWKTLAIREDALDRIEKTVHEEIEKAKVFLKIR